MDIKCIMYIFDCVHDCTDNICNGIATNLVKKFNYIFNIRIAFGGNAADFGSSVKESLEHILLTEDVVNLAIMAYFDAISDGIIFKDEELLHKYFGIIKNDPELFNNFFT